MIAALFVVKDGIYFNDSRIDPWCADRNALLYKGKNHVIAHPPCERWGGYWHGGPSAKVKRYKGDDSGCFAHALWATRTFGGVIEHPQGSHAWPWFGLQKPDNTGAWIRADEYGGWTVAVRQGHYGHNAEKPTWLYAVNTKRPKLNAEKCGNKMPIEESFATNEARKRARAAGLKPAKRLPVKELAATPNEFKELLISLF